MNEKKFRVLAVGDIVGHAGLQYLKDNLPALKKKYLPDLVIVNGENAAEIRGISREDAKEIFSCGADVITTGNHVFGQRNIYEILDDEKNLLRPANYPGTAPGHGSVIFNAAGIRVLIMNLRGNVELSPALGCPFAATDLILRRESGNFDAAVLDMHAEATSEKAAMAHYLDGRVSAVFGTHTHVATADERILPGGTGFITDIGMTGPAGGILGCDPKPIIAQFTSAMPQRYSVADGECAGGAVIFDLDLNSCHSPAPCCRVLRVKF
ncbi:MAG: TIGR00282 family metallophosphoesterase [Clostridia bacterium]|nr:TIGR00282 family metallophosphoesterase [Clostridia bacterium]